MIRVDSRNMLACGRQKNQQRRFLLAAIALTGIVMSWEIKSHWEVLAGITGALVLAFTAYVELIVPLGRRYRLRRPCDAYFHVVPLHHGEVPYVIQDDSGHNLKELVLPANSLNTIEIQYRPKMSFTAEAVLFGCDGDFNNRPKIVRRVSPFTKLGKASWEPGVDDSDTIDRENRYHIRTPGSVRHAGTWYTVGFEVQTNAPGIYIARLAFITEVDASSAVLTIRVEEKPSTLMKCYVRKHWGCYIRPSNRRSNSKGKGNLPLRDDSTH